MKGQLLSQDVYVAIDIGTTKICVLVGRKIAEGSIEIIGIGKAPSQGVTKGIVVDIASVVQSIRLAVKEAELMAGCKIESAYIGISGAHIKSSLSHGMVPIKRGYVRQSDVLHVLSAAKAVPLQADQQILHALPQFYTINNDTKVKDPVGMYGVRLEAHVNIITGAVASVQNLAKCCQLAGVTVDDIVLEPLASALAVLSEDECNLGVAVLDIGGGTADLSLYHNGTLRYAWVVPVAGTHFTHDLAVCLRTTLKEAERIKTMYGVVDSEFENAIVEIEAVHGEEKQQVAVSEISNILAARGYELISLVKQELQERELFPFITTGLVLTGGGALLKGMKEIAQELLQVPVRIGRPRLSSFYKETLDSPMYATAYGLMLYAVRKSGKDSLNSLEGPLVSRVFWRMKSWVYDFF